MVYAQLLLNRCRDKFYSEQEQMSTAKYCKTNFQVTIVLHLYLFCLQEGIWKFLQEENYAPFPCT